MNIEELIGEYNTADIYVTATKTEGFYRLIIEAFASRLPAVTKDASNLFDSVCLATLHHITALDAGVLYDGSENSFAYAISDVIEQYEKMAENAVRYANLFDNLNMLPKYFDLFERVLSNGSKSGTDVK
jgi:glycosyltransferase involved in cell wall biosynthesis